MGEIRDDEVDAYVQDRMYKLDREAATLFYMLFKRHALGEIVACTETNFLLGQVMAARNYHSNLTKFLLQDEQFAKHEEKEGDHEDQKKNESHCHTDPDDAHHRLKQGIMIKSQIANSSQPLPLENEGVNHIFFSDNDHYIGVVQDKEVIIF